VYQSWEMALQPADHTSLAGVDPCQSLAAIPPVLPPSSAAVGASMRSGSVESVGNTPVWRSFSCSSPRRSLPPAAPLASARTPMTWPACRTSNPPPTTGWTSRTAGCDVGSGSSDAILDPSWAPNPTPLFSSSQLRDSLRLKASCLNPRISRRGRRSRAGIPLWTLGIHPFVPGHKCLVTPGSTAPPRRVSFKKVRRPSTTWGRPTSCTGCAYFWRNLTFGQNRLPLNPPPSSSLLRAKNGFGVRVRSRAHGICLPIGRVSPHSPDIVPFSFNQKYHKYGAPVRSAASSVALSCLRGSSLPLDTRFVPGFAATLEKHQFSWPGIFRLFSLSALPSRAILGIIWLVSFPPAGECAFFTDICFILSYSFVFMTRV
jgi:hypothetical protein